MKEPDYNYIATLVKRVWHNDSDAFAELYAMTYSKIYNYSCHYLRDTYLAQDAVQEVYILALKNIQKIKDPSLFVAWVNQIAFHICYDMCKKNNANYGNLDEEVLDLVQDTHIDSNPEAHVFQNDEKRRLNEAVEKLPFNERQVIIMRFYNNMKLDDIADALAISKSSVKRYLASGQENLQNFMR
jgi:RNA polymerase sigma factor (sigma-70 family)